MCIFCVCSALDWEPTPLRPCPFPSKTKQNLHCVSCVCSILPPPKTQTKHETKLCVSCVYSTLDWEPTPLRPWPTVSSSRSTLQVARIKVSKLNQGRSSPTKNNDMLFCRVLSTQRFLRWKETLQWGTSLKPDVESQHAKFTPKPKLKEF